jgi:hypothetical protein
MDSNKSSMQDKDEEYARKRLAEMEEEERHGFLGMSESELMRMHAPTENHAMPGFSNATSRAALSRRRR